MKPEVESMEGKEQLSCVFWLVGPDLQNTMSMNIFTVENPVFSVGLLRTFSPAQ